MTARPTRPVTGSALLEAVAVMDRLRSPGGCPWYAEQTHSSLAPYAIEEGHEVADAAETGDAAALAEELGDLLLQVLVHARIAAEAPAGDRFDIDDVAHALVAKLVRRNPHVFAPTEAPPPCPPAGAAPQTPDASALSVEDVHAQWDAIKTVEKQREHVLDDIPASLPALSRAQKVVSRLRKSGEPPSGADSNHDDDAARLGAALLALVIEADALGVDAEASLREATRGLERASRA